MNKTEGTGVTEPSPPRDRHAAVDGSRSPRSEPQPLSYDEFVVAHLAGLARYARVLTGDRQVAHDVLADALVAARGGWSRIERMEFPAAYVRRIVTTTFLAERRRWSTRHIRPFAAVPEPAAADPTSSVDDRSALHTLLAGLPRQQRAAIVLRFYLDLTDDEIAAELRCSAGAVRGYISRGLATLRVVVTEADAPVLRPRAGTAAPDTNPGRRP